MKRLNHAWDLRLIFFYVSYCFLIAAWNILIRNYPAICSGGNELEQTWCQTHPKALKEQYLGFTVDLVYLNRPFFGCKKKNKPSNNWIFKISKIKTFYLLRQIWKTKFVLNRNVQAVQPWTLVRRKLSIWGYSYSNCSKCEFLYTARAYACCVWPFK